MKKKFPIKKNTPDTRPSIIKSKSTSAASLPRPVGTGKIRVNSRSPIQPRVGSSAGSRSGTVISPIGSLRSSQSSPIVEKRDKTPRILEGFAELWTLLFTTPVHLDSALSKQATRLKGILAQIVPAILLRPTSLAEAMGVGVPENEPWTLDEKELVRWRPAHLLVERLYESMSQKWPDLQPASSDFPPVMLEEWNASWDAKTVKELVDTLGREAPLSLRASQRMGAPELLKELTELKLPIRIELSDFAPWGVRLAGYAPVLNTDLYKKGGFEIQDEGSQLMALFALWPERMGGFLSEKPGPVRISKKKSIKAQAEHLTSSKEKEAVPAIVIDACAGAGGKSLAMADALKGKGRVFAYDTSIKKLQALRRRATRMDLNNIQAVLVQEGNETDIIERFQGKADVVLVDAPCTGWGVLRRNPDIKWRQKKESLTRMPDIQIRLLSLYSSLVAPGGRLIYGVCTFRLSETRELVERFLESHPDFTALEGGFLGPGPCDGFFMQAFKRNKS